jgi:hypothetical protein
MNFELLMILPLMGMEGNTMSKRLEGQSALVTGAAAGIG